MLKRTVPFTAAKTEGSRLRSRISRETMEDGWPVMDLVEPFVQGLRKRIQEENERIKDETTLRIKKKIFQHFSDSQGHEEKWALEDVKSHLESFWKEFEADDGATTSERTLTNDGDQKGKSIEKDAQLLQMFATSAPEDNKLVSKISWKKNPIKIGLPKEVEQDCLDVIGLYLLGYWPDVNGTPKYVPGCICEFDEESEKHLIMYEDGDLEWVDLDESIAEGDVLLQDQPKTKDKTFWQRVPVVCGEDCLKGHNFDAENGIYIKGQFHLRDNTVRYPDRDLANGTAEVTPNDFEKAAGLAAARKWKQSIKVLGPDGPITTIGKFIVMEARKKIAKGPPKPNPAWPQRYKELAQEAPSHQNIMLSGYNGSREKRKLQSISLNEQRVQARALQNAASMNPSGSNLKTSTSLDLCSLPAMRWPEAAVATTHSAQATAQKSVGPQA